MKPNNKDIFMGLAALLLVLASSSLGAPHLRGYLADELAEELKIMEQFNCTGKYFSPEDDEARSKECFVYELENVKKTCTIAENAEDNVPDVIFTVKRTAKQFFSISTFTNRSCNGYEPKHFKDYLKDFKMLVQRTNNMQVNIGRSVV